MIDRFFVIKKNDKSIRNQNIRFSFQLMLLKDRISFPTIKLTGLTKQFLDESKHYVNLLKLKAFYFTFE